MIETSDINYWFEFRQTHPKFPESAVACDPYESREEAKGAREKTKAWYFFPINQRSTRTMRDKAAQRT